MSDEERAHSKFSASGSERWLNCSASVALEEASPPSKDNFWSSEGTLAHEVLECRLKRKPLPDNFDITDEMLAHVDKVVRKIKAIHATYGGALLVEQRVFASFIHEEMFGTCDAIIAGDDGTLHIIDFKYGAGSIVEAEKNTQLIQYALSVAESYDWGFFKVKMWIMQPRGGEDWHKSWTIDIDTLKNFWLPIWQSGVKRVESGKAKPFPGGWCHWCRAKNTCPAKIESRAEKVSEMFNKEPLTSEGKNGFKEKGAAKKTGTKKATKKKKKSTSKKKASDFRKATQLAAAPKTAATGPVSNGIDDSFDEIVDSNIDNDHIPEVDENDFEGDEFRTGLI